MKQPDPNATIQLDRVDRLDDIQLDDPESPAPPPVRSARPGSSAGPPPLPPGASLPPSSPLPSYNTPSYNAPPYGEALASRAPAPAPKSKGKTIVQAVLFVALLGAAVVGGLKLGSSFRSAPVAKVAPAVVLVEPAASASAAVPTAAPAVLTMPTVEMTDTPSGSKEAPETK